MSHSSGVMVNTTFLLMDEMIRVRAMHEFVHQDCVDIIINDGAHKHSCTLKPLSILNTGPNFSAYFSEYTFEVKNLKTVQRSE